MDGQSARWWKEMGGALLLYLLIIVAFLLADRYSYRQGANDMSPGLEVALGCGVLLLVAFVRSIVVAAKRRGKFGWLPAWYLVLLSCLPRG